MCLRRPRAGRAVAIGGETAGTTSRPRCASRTLLVERSSSHRDRRRAAPRPARRQTPPHRHRHPGPAHGRASVPCPWTPATSSPPPPSATAPATPRSSPPSSDRWVRSSMSAAVTAWSRPRSGRRWLCVTGTAGSPAAGGCRWPATPTVTSNTGRGPRRRPQPVCPRAHHRAPRDSATAANPLDRRPEFRRPPPMREPAPASTDVSGPSRRTPNRHKTRADPSGAIGRSRTMPAARPRSGRHSMP